MQHLPWEINSKSTSAAGFVLGGQSDWVDSVFSFRGGLQKRLLLWIELEQHCEKNLVWSHWEILLREKK